MKTHFFYKKVKPIIRGTDLLYSVNSKRGVTECSGLTRMVVCNKGLYEVFKVFYSTECNKKKKATKTKPEVLRQNLTTRVTVLSTR